MGQRAIRGAEGPLEETEREWETEETYGRILHWLSWRGVSLRIDSVDVESLLRLTQLTESLTLRQLSVREMNQAKTGIHNQLWRL